jgi:hypothetical protein
MIDNHLSNQISFLFLVRSKIFKSFLSLEIPSCCSVTKTKDYEYIPYQSKQSSTTKNDYVSFSSIFLSFNSIEFYILGWSRWMSFIVFIVFKRFRHLNSNKYFVHYFNKSQLSSIPINKYTCKWFMYTFNIIWSQLYSTRSNEHIKFQCNYLAFCSNINWMLPLLMSSLYQ